MATTQEEINIRMRLKDEASSALNSLKANIIGIATAWASWKTVETVIGGIFNETMELEKQMARLGGAVRRANLDWDTSKPIIDKFTDSLQATKGVIDDYSRESLVRALDYTKDLNKAMEITSVAADLAAAKEMELTAATDLLGKAYLGNTAMLGKYGIVISETIPKADRFQAVVDQINQRFGGAAADQMNTMSNSLARLKDALGDLAAEIGNKLGGDGGWSTIMNSLTDTLNSLKYALTDTYDFWVRFNIAIVGLFSDSLALKLGMERVREETERMNAELMKSPVLFEAGSVPARDYALAIRSIGQETKDAAAVIDGSAKIFEEFLKATFKPQFMDLAATQSSSLEEHDKKVKGFVDAQKQAAETLQRMTETAINTEETMADRAEELGLVFDFTLMTMEEVDAYLKRIGLTSVTTAAVMQSAFDRALDSISKDLKETFLDGRNAATLFAGTATTAINSFTAYTAEALLDTKTGAKEVFKQMADDFVRYFIEEALKQLATKFVVQVLGFLGSLLGFGGAGSIVTGGGSGVSTDVLAGLSGVSSAGYGGVSGAGGGSIVIVNNYGNMTDDFIDRNIVSRIEKRAASGFNSIQVRRGFSTGRSAMRTS